MPPLIPGRLLHVDAAAALGAGVVVLALAPWLAGLYAVPRAWVLLNGAVNLAYGTASGSLARRARRPVALVAALAIANLAWGMGCVALLIALRDRASPFGLAHLAGEALFVGSLGALEWRHRHRLGGQA